MTTPKNITEWLNTKTGNAVVMFLAGAIVVLVAIGKISVPWGKQTAPNDLITKEDVQAIFKASLDEKLGPIQRAQDVQAQKIEALGLEVANLKGRMQLAGLNNRISAMGAGSGERN